MKYNEFTEGKNMKYNELGNTGLKVSEIGLGCEGFIGRDDEFTNAIFGMAFDAGVNCMDLYSPDPDVHRRVGKIIHDRRDSFVLQAHLCTIWENEQYKATRDINEVKVSFEAMLNNLDTDYIDIGMIHYVDSMSTWNDVVNGGIMDYALELKEKGIIKHIGMSSHNPDVALEAIESGNVEVLMFSVNPCYDLLPGDEDIEKLFSGESYKDNFINFDPQRVKLYETCQRLGVGITVMKAFGGGELLTDKSPAGKAMTPSQCIHYALTRPAVAAIMSGIRSAEDLEASLYYESASDEEKDYASVFATFPKISWEGHCMYCGHCAPCPMGINVASVTKFLNLARAQGEVPETVREHYDALDSHAEDCVECGSCESRCPFRVSVIENMRSARETFGR